MKKTTIRVEKKNADLLNEVYKSFTNACEEAVGAWPFVRRATLAEIKAKLTREEVMLLVDSFNGITMPYEHRINKAFVQAHIQDAVEYEKLDKKWKVDIPMLLRKLEYLSAAQHYTLVEEVILFWERKNENLDEFVKRIL